MQANNIFDFRRMQLYLQKHFADQLRFYLMGALATFGLVTLIGILMVLSHNHFDKVSDIVPFYYVGLFAGGLLFTSRSFNELVHKEKGVDFLLLPASQFEKFLTLFLISTIGFFLFYHVSLYLSVNIVEKVQVAVNGLHVQNDYKFLSDPDEKVYVYYVYFVLQSIFLFGATCFHKYSFIKTVLCLLLFLFGLFLINSVAVALLFGWKNGFWRPSVPFFLVHKLEEQHGILHGNGTYIIPRWLLDTHTFILRFVLAPVFWTLAYFRLKDQEI